MLKGWILSLALIGGWEIAQIGFFHAARIARKFLCMTLLFLPTLPLLAALYLRTPPDLGFLPAHLASTPTGLGLANMLFAHVLLYCTHVMCFFYFDRSITLRVLCEFDRAEGRFLSVEHLRSAYSLGEQLQGRLRTLAANRYLLERNGRFFLTAKGRLFARALALSRRLFPMRS